MGRPGGLRHALLLLLAFCPWQSDCADPAPAGRSEFACGQPATAISAIQGSGPASPMVGAAVDVEAVVVGVFQAAQGLGGMFVQEEDADRDQDELTSEGLFVHTGFGAAIGDLVRLRGTVTEFEGLTELHRVTRLLICPNGGKLPSAATLRLPLASGNALEALEGMYVTLPQTLVLTDNYQLWQFGELTVSSRRLQQPTEVATPGAAANERSAQNDLDRLLIDDGRNGRNLPVTLSGQDNATRFSASNTLRLGQQISALAGVLHFGFGHFRLQPTQPYRINAGTNPRNATPGAVGGSLRVSSFNLSNYFSSAARSGPVCGPERQQQCRGADTPTERQRQLHKLLAAMAAINADVFTLMELENNPRQSLREITDALNTAAGQQTFSYLDTGTLGQDAIKVGMLYKPGSVVPEGRFALLDHRRDARFDDRRNRPALAQTFHTRDGRASLTIVAVHLKSKNCADASGPDADRHDGQACYNRSRGAAAMALADWALSDPTGTGAGHVLILGDFNSYRMEDPVRIMLGKGLADLSSRFEGTAGYTYVYQGLGGTLDYAFGNPALARRVSGATAWHINADEPRALDFRAEAGKPEEYFATDAFRSSDHDPIIIGLDMGPAPGTASRAVAKHPSAGWPRMLLAGVLAMLLLGLGLSRTSMFRARP